MPNTIANGIRIEYETFGDPAAKPLLLVYGIGGQMIDWDEAFCAQLADRGHFVIRFDNRDVGLSQHFDDAGIPDMEELARKLGAGEDTDAPYTFDDMAADGIGLLDELGINSSHICGMSMGGMIVQVMAVNHPDRVRSMTSIMSTTGNPDLPPAEPEAMAALTAKAPTIRDEFIDFSVARSKIVSGGGFKFDEPKLRAAAAAAYDRAFHPEGMARQMAAAIANGSRVDALKKLDVPTLVIHGIQDPLVPVTGGKDTAASVLNAELVLIDGMGHELPRGAWPQIIDPICALTERAS